MSGYIAYISARVTPIGVKFCMMIYIMVPDRSSYLLGAVPPGDPQFLNFGHLTANVSKTVSDSATCQSVAW